MTEPTQPPSVTIEGVPESIRRADYLAMITSLGLDPRDLTELVFGRDAITATVIARHPDHGRPYEDPTERNALAKHHIVIPVKDSEETR